ncbi:MAG: hypothetical protein LBE12_12030 [Planctomycetaceae bacterium]|nr:hypothetical protein [Planctomycetaceae bacterium]
MSQADYDLTGNNSACDTINYQLSTLHYQLLSRSVDILPKDLFITGYSIITIITKRSVNLSVIPVHTEQQSV